MCVLFFDFYKDLLVDIVVFDILLGGEVDVDVFDFFRGGQQTEDVAFDVVIYLTDDFSG